MQSGTLTVCDHSLHQLSDSQKRAFRISHIGSVFQDFGLIEYLSILNNILHPIRINTSVRMDLNVKRQAKQLAHQFGLKEKLQKYPECLSHGEKQRLAVIRAIINQPSIILLDEPTASLDPRNKQHLLEFIIDYTKEKNACLVVATHDYDILEAFDYVVDFNAFRVTGND